MKGLDLDVILGKGEGLAVFDESVRSGGFGAGVGFDGGSAGVVGQLSTKGGIECIRTSSQGTGMRDQLAHEFDVTTAVIVVVMSGDQRSDL